MAKKTKPEPETPAADAAPHAYVDGSPAGRRARYELVLRAASPLAQAEGTIGNHTLVMARKLRLPDGSFARVPVVTADALRHQLREAAAYALLDRAGIGGGLTEAALRLLFNGGMLTGRGDANAVRLAEYRRLVDLLPSLALLGGCANNHMVAGQIEVSDLRLWCDETTALASAWQRAECAARGAVASAREHLDEEQRVRFDPTRRKATARLLAPDAADAVARVLEASERAHAEDDAPAREATKGTMLPRTCEVVVPGALLFAEVTATVYSDLEEDAFHVALLTWLHDPWIGGKRGTGHGRLELLAAQRVALAGPGDAHAHAGTALATGVGALFSAAVRDRRDAIRAALAAVDA